MPRNPRYITNSLTITVNTVSITRRAEAIINVDNGDAARAGVQHGQQGRDAAEGGSVANAGGNGDDGARD